MFYKDCGLEAWSYLTTKKVVSYQDIMNQVVWNNKYILGLGKPIYHPFFRNHGLNKVGDLVSKDHIFLKSTKILGAKLTLSQRFVLMGKSIPCLVNGATL